MLFALYKQLRNLRNSSSRMGRKSPSATAPICTMPEMMHTPHLLSWFLTNLKVK